MNDKLLVSIIVLVVLFAHLFLFRWIKFKVDEAVIIKFIKASSSAEINTSTIAQATQLKLSRAEYVCHKSKSITLP